MPRTRFKPVRISELFPDNGAQQETVQSIQQSKRKFIPQRITAAGLEEFSPVAKTRKVQTMSAKANSEKKRFTAVCKVLTAADVESMCTYVPYSKKSKNSATKTARKELLSTDKKRALRSNYRSTTFNKNVEPKKSAPSKKLDMMNPLIDINEAEAVLLKGARVGFKRPIQEPSSQNSKLTRAALPRLLLHPNQMKQKLAETETGSKSPSPIVSSQLAEMSFENLDNTVRNNPTKFLDVSETDSEFLEMERKIGVEFAGGQAMPFPQASSSRTKTTLKFDSPNKENRNLTGKIMDILQDVDGEFKKLKQHCESFETKFAESKREIVEILKSLPGNSGDFNCDKKEEKLAPLMPRLENLRMSTLKKVLNDTTLNNTTAKNKGLERTLNLYNSMRKAYMSILSTPKFDRSTLQTPTSVRRPKNSVSKKVQKQCMLLYDTPQK